MSSIITKPSAKKGDKATSTIEVSCGANQGQYPVCGKSIGQVKEILKEVLNVPRMSDGLINGKVKDDSYSLKEGDTLEFMKPSGEKGDIAIPNYYYFCFGLV